METTQKIDFTRVNNDVNGNPRYVCHFFNLTTDKEQSEAYKTSKNHINYLYNLALGRAHKIGGRKFHNKQFGGGIVFQSYSLPELERQINDLKNS